MCTFTHYGFLKLTDPGCVVSPTLYLIPAFSGHLVACIGDSSDGDGRMHRSSSCEGRLQAAVGQAPWLEEHH